MSTADNYFCAIFLERGQDLLWLMALLICHACLRGDEKGWQIVAHARNHRSKVCVLDGQIDSRFERTADLALSSSRLQCLVDGIPDELHLIKQSCLIAQIKVSFDDWIVGQEHTVQIPVKTCQWCRQMLPDILCHMWSDRGKQSGQSVQEMHKNSLCGSSRR